MKSPTRTEDLCNRLADEIITGQIVPGTRLDEHSLAERFSVSRTPVREALRHLTAIGLAVPGGMRSLYAAGVTSEKRRELFEVMAELEAICARMAAMRMSSAERKALEDLHLQSAERMRSGDRESYSDDNFLFHAAIYRGSHNATIEEMAHGTRKRLAPFRAGQFKVLGRLGKSFAEHQRVVDAILRGDESGAEAAMLEHVALVSDASAVYVGETASRSRRAAR
jgi:DNA-binding GntR family transcriptional regulator